MRAVKGGLSDLEWKSVSETDDPRGISQEQRGHGAADAPCERRHDDAYNDLNRSTKNFTIRPQESVLAFAFNSGVPPSSKSYPVTG